MQIWHIVPRISHETGERDYTDTSCLVDRQKTVNGIHFVAQKSEPIDADVFYLSLRAKRDGEATVAWVILSPCFFLCYVLFFRVPRVEFLLAVEIYECMLLLVHHCDGVYIHLGVVSRTYLGVFAYEFVPIFAFFPLSAMPVQLQAQFRHLWCSLTTVDRENTVCLIPSI